MSKEKPEVGDVMLHKASNRKAIINYSSMLKDENEIAYILFDGIRTFALEEYVVKENYTYLGKSKVSIKEFFDVRD